MSRVDTTKILATEIDKMNQPPNAFVAASAIGEYFQVSFLYYTYSM